MEHLALYRKWRPQNFNTIVGQDDNVAILKNAVKTNRIVHAYLFCGTRGTGKTSTARILAKALNCEHPEDGEPCNACEACRAITEGSFMDVIEIDAASNRTIDETRDLLEKVHFVPVAGKYKVYIIDEAHMLTTESFNALLKTFEEPPAHVVFILATTEARKVPLTILSRCQRYDFKPIAETTLATALKRIAEAEGMDADEDAIELLAEKARGSMRDALTLMDQAMGGDRVMTAAELNRLTGSVPYDFWPGFFRHIAASDLPAVFRDLDEIEREGKDLRQFFRDFREFAGDLLTVADADGASRYQQILKECAGLFTAGDILEIITITGESEIVFRYNRDGKSVCRFLMARIMKTLMAPAAPPAPAEITDPVAGPAQKPKAATAKNSKSYVFPNEEIHDTTTPRDEIIPPWEDAPPTMGDEAMTAPPAVEATPAPAATAKPTVTENSNENLEQLWSNLLKGVKGKNTSTYTWLSHGELSEASGSEICVTYRSGDQLYFNKIQEAEHRAAVEAVLAEIKGRPVRLKVTTETPVNDELSLF